MHRANIAVTRSKHSAPSHPRNNNHHKGCDGEKYLICLTKQFQAQIYLLNLLKLHLDCFSHQMQFGSDLLKILLHLQIYITLLFSLAAKAFKMSQSRYLEFVWLSATSAVTEEKEQNVECHHYHVIKKGSRQELVFAI